MRQFDFVNALTVDSAVNLLSSLQERAYVAAGGTNVMVDIRANKHNARTLVNIRDIEELKGITYQDGQVSVGALTTIAALAASDSIRTHAPCLHMAANVFADPITRNSATIAGNVASASPAADIAPPLIVLDAVAHVISALGPREISMSKFFTGVNKTCLRPDELITHFTFQSAKSGFIKLGLRNSMTISIVTAAAAIIMDEDGIVRDIRVALGSVAPTPVRAQSVEAALINKKLDEEALAAAAAQVECDIRPIDDIRATGAYRRAVAPVCVKRAIRLAAYGACT